jgi:hypothetical protein
MLKMGKVHFTVSKATPIAKVLKFQTFLTIRESESLVCCQEMGVYIDTHLNPHLFLQTGHKTNTR